MSLTLTLLLLAAQPDGRTIVVTGRRDAEAALKACLERHCSPKEDIDATLAYAEQLFEAGDYAGARTVLKSSLGRNADEARRYPVEVSDLYRANGLVANHLGFERDYYLSTINVLRALKAGIPKQDYRHFGARLEIAAMMARVRNSDEARHAYESLAEDAAKAGRRDIAAIARLKAAWFDYRKAPEQDGRERIARIAASTDPELRWPTLMAKLYLANIARREGRDSEAEALLNEVAAAAGGKAPVLVYSPPYELVQREIESSTDPTKLDMLGYYKRRSDSFEKQWIDVGFWVQPDGRVSDLEVLRAGRDSDWAKPLLTSISGRLYTRMPDRTPVYRMERYTYTAGFESASGSHLQQRSPRARIEYYDLTGQAAPGGG